MENDSLRVVDAPAQQLGYAYQHCSLKHQVANSTLQVNRYDQPLQRYLWASAVRLVELAGLLFEFCAVIAQRRPFQFLCEIRSSDMLDPTLGGRRAVLDEQSAVPVIPTTHEAAADYPRLTRALKIALHSSIHVASYEVAFGCAAGTAIVAAEDGVEQSGGVTTG